MVVIFIMVLVAVVILVMVVMVFVPPAMPPVIMMSITVIISVTIPVAVPIPITISVPIAIAVRGTNPAPVAGRRYTSVRRSRRNAVMPIHVLHSTFHATNLALIVGSLVALPA